MFTVDLSSLNMKETDLNIPTTTFSEKVDIIEKEEADSHDQVEPVTTLHLNKSATRVRESLSKLRSLAYIVNSVELLGRVVSFADGTLLGVLLNAVCSRFGLDNGLIVLSDGFVCFLFFLDGNLFKDIIIFLFLGTLVCLVLGVGSSVNPTSLGQPASSFFIIPSKSALA
jgi:Na+-transporting methylmalonyl-CoA/oxaloacetate decarboxylase gamma subunit